ncbi:bifunctional riboflavin kinase/FMN adenylyltransferase [Acidithiobacillus thiooxidans]|uniref:Riboflavin biosynthesis protein n=1 Tax=Acidithiobacillus thiooxidans TaxID=930 RepID=A0A1C2IKA8_ACITH|nr:bifunctional riboflavin kinase/FAD synthetase [Acidithiobacillus thiooxidans]OCX71235.1 bifunctional riboflavin kinase/FMN adenylyltransferase [Acidithiobacillus thiooxidans]OCX76466.1 bifunctional riboflavin kinase/FMN adenylyltransferase [Acidithiobacillus thiooxidans]OCX76956.1 bifunctional riboflavin kinase/FMN adenylyltransferase [Acidithiobacillus thiooxidans]OCX78562.1 bifunctional riboflavin kinase/FMN adenylyltransferase [Acidithiobacillus thiooxidans]OCX84526.1 bifunctional ribofl
MNFPGFFHRRSHCPASSALAVSIGNFDGVHRGHQALLQSLRQSDLATAVLTFEPLPREFFQTSRAAPRLSSLREKIDALRHYDVDQIYCLPFDQALARLSAEDFITRILVQRLQCRFLVVGHDFRFGAARRGDLEMLQHFGRQYGFAVMEQPAFSLDGQRVSSTGIRAALLAGNLDQARHWLGRPYSLCGKIVHGDHLGRELGFPTANIPLNRRPVPVKGIFAGRLHSPQGSWIAAISIGLRPTVGGKQMVLEAHCLDADSPDLYGQRVQVELHQQLRHEEKYPDLDALKAAIARDIINTRRFFAEHP